MATQHLQVLKSKEPPDQLGIPNPLPCIPLSFGYGPHAVPANLEAGECTWVAFLKHLAHSLERDVVPRPLPYGVALVAQKPQQPVGQMLAVCWNLVIGVVLVAEGVHHDVPPPCDFKIRRIPSHG